ncbi:putative amine oxidase [copper-containing] [Mytilus edulis]|uniref:putative amine oxidase [copper-containing] n=1 Tax=Mytilus edulis TaxID=6550 RepID=UPI0039F0C0EC
MDKVPQKREEDPTRKWRCFALFLLLFTFFVIAGMATVVIYYEIIQHQSSDEQNSPNFLPLQSGQHSLFRDLNTDEVTAIRNYILNQPAFNITNDTNFSLGKCYVFLTEVYLPNKSDILTFIETNQNPPPCRYARTVLFRGDLQPPRVEEYIIGPLRNITFHRILVSKHYQKSVPFLFRPFSELDHSIMNNILKIVEYNIRFILQNSYEASFYDCQHHCLKAEYFSPMAPSVSGKDVRLVWYWTHHDVEDYLLYPVDLFLLVNMTGSDSSAYKLENIWYGGKLYDSSEQLAAEYLAGKTQKSYIPYTKRTKNKNAMYANRHNIYKTNVLQPLLTFNVRNNHIEYDSWKFDIHMSTSRGPSLFNIKFRDVTYAYEVSLQEISIFHNGYKRWMRYSDMTYSGFLLGTKARELVPGADCPEMSTFVDSAHVFAGRFDLKVFPNSFCVFEQPTGMVLRRHYSSSTYSGSEDTILVLRTILAIFNYDHVIDFVFHKNGIMDVRTSYSGYPLPTIYSPEETRYGFRLNEHLVANIHQHSYHFKVDIDVFSQTNRFETFDIGPKIQNSDWVIKAFEKYEQIKFTRTLKMTENQALFKSCSKSDSFFIFYDREHLTLYKDPKAIRLQVRSQETNFVSENIGNEASVSWKRYMLVVSKIHEDERSSSSIYSTWDAKETTVNFQSYIDDNESIIDQDLVAWVTLSATHIPHRENYPLTSTTDNNQHFSLIPFNLFDEDPSVNSVDTVTKSINVKKQQSER